MMQNRDGCTLNNTISAGLSTCYWAFIEKESLVLHSLLVTLRNVLLSWSKQVCNQASEESVLSPWRDFPHMSDMELTIDMVQYPDGRYVAVQQNSQGHQCYTKVHSEAFEGLVVDPGVIGAIPMDEVDDLKVLWWLAQAERNARQTRLLRAKEIFSAMEFAGMGSPVVVRKPNWGSSPVETKVPVVDYATGLEWVMDETPELPVKGYRKQAALTLSYDARIFSATHKETHVSDYKHPKWSRK